MRLIVTGMTANHGGMETYIIEMFRTLKNRIDFTFIVNTDLPIAYQEEILDNGGKIVRLPSKRKHLFSHRKGYTHFFKDNRGKYDLIYCNLLSLTNMDDITYALKNGFPVIVHSHNNNDDVPGRSHEAPRPDHAPPLARQGRGRRMRPAASAQYEMTKKKPAYPPRRSRARRAP